MWGDEEMRKEWAEGRREKKGKRKREEGWKGEGKGLRKHE